MSKGLYVHDYDADEAPNPACCDDPGLLCTQCARLALSNNAFVMGDDEDDSNSLDGIAGFTEYDSFQQGLDEDMLPLPRTFADVTEEMERKYPELPKDTGSNSDVMGFDPEEIPEHLKSMFEMPRSPSPRRATRNVDYSGCGGSALPHYGSARNAREDDLLNIPTINFAEVAKENASGCGCGNGLAANEADDPDMLPLPTMTF